MAFQVDFRGAVKRVMVLMMLADGDVRAEEIEAIRAVYGRLVKTEAMTDKEIEREIYMAKSDGRSIEQFLMVLSAVLSDEGKAMIVKAAYMVAAADGELHAEEQKLISTIASSLHIDHEQLKRIVASLPRLA